MADWVFRGSLSQASWYSSGLNLFIVRNFSTISLIGSELSDLVSADIRKHLRIGFRGRRAILPYRNPGMQQADSSNEEW